MEAEKVKRKIWKKENARRKHNYVPFVMELLKLLASKGIVFSTSTTLRIRISDGLNGIGSNELYACFCDEKVN